MNERRKRRTFDEEFKLMVVKLIHNGSNRKDVIAEFELTPSTLDKWVRQYSNNGSFSTEGNLTKEQIEIITLKKELKKAQMENDILKQAALIFARK